MHFGWWKQKWQVHHYPWRPCPPPHAWRMWIIFVSTTSFLLYNSTSKASPFFAAFDGRDRGTSFFFFFFCIFIREVVFLPTQSNSVARCWIVIVVGRCSGAPCTLYYIAFVAVVSRSFPSHRFTHTRKCHDVLPPVCITLKCGDIYLDVTSMHYVFWTHPTLPYTYYIYILYYIQLNRNSYV